MVTWEREVCWANGCYTDVVTRVECVMVLVEMLEGFG